jgi:hypothetical protein
VALPLGRVLPAGARGRAGAAFTAALGIAEQQA